MVLLETIKHIDDLAKPRRKRPFARPVGLDIGLRFPKLGTNGR